MTIYSCVLVVLLRAAKYSAIAHLAEGLSLPKFVRGSVWLAGIEPNFCRQARVAPPSILAIDESIGQANELDWLGTSLTLLSPPQRYSSVL